MNDLFKDMAGLLESGESIVVATLFDKSGSAPRTAGAKMVVRRDGSILGTVGGGCLEMCAIHAAQQVFQKKQSIIQAFDLSGEDIAGMDMICGGSGEILLDYMEADAENRRVCQEAALAVEKRQKAWLITALGDNTGTTWPLRQQCLVRQNGELIGALHCEPEFLTKLTSGPAKISIHAEVLEGQRFLVEAIRPCRTLYIFGAGHVSQKLAPLCETVGFRTVVLDDRSEYANKNRFPEAAMVLLIDSFQHLPSLDIDDTSFLVIVTRGHLHDKTILEYGLRTKARYIGMIGSRRKRDKIFAALQEQGFTDTDLRRVYSPIGMDILAETPEEIAVSIVGELIKVRAEME
jgi:xanthine dehydrogenase accessory factor